MILDQHLSLSDFLSVVRGGESVQLSDAARERILRARAVIERIVDGQAAVYGVNTGFGKFASVQVPRAGLEELQLNLILSHAIGGENLPGEVVRGMLLLRAQSLALGALGRAAGGGGAAALAAERGAHPVIPAQGVWARRGIWRRWRTWRWA